MSDSIILSESVSLVLSEKSSETTLVNNENTTNTVESVSSSTIVSTEQTILIVTEGSQGPAGPAGIVEDEMLYAKRIDFINDNLLYRGEAAVGALNSAPVWRIRKVSIGTDGDISETWVNGNANFTNVWDDRLTGVYS